MRVLATSVSFTKLIEWHVIDTSGEPIPIAEGRKAIYRITLQEWKKEAQALKGAKSWRGVLKKARNYAVRGDAETVRTLMGYKGWDEIDEMMGDIMLLAKDLYAEIRSGGYPIPRKKAGPLIYKYFLDHVIKELNKIPDDVTEIDPKKWPHVYMLAYCILEKNYAVTPAAWHIPFILDLHYTIEISDIEKLDGKRPKIISYKPEEVPEMLKYLELSKWDKIYVEILSDALERPETYAKEMPKILESAREKYTDIVTALAVVTWRYLNKNARADVLARVQDSELKELLSTDTYTAVAVWAAYNGWEKPTWINLSDDEWIELRNMPVEHIPKRKSLQEIMQELKQLTFVSPFIQL